MSRRPGRPVSPFGAGVECSHVRIDGAERDQCAETGHLARPGDLDRIAGLGIRTLRYPLLWATIERPDGSFDFTRCAARFERLRTLGVAPIAGFLHHGSGPGGLDPLGPDFVPRFARFAAAAARRFDWIEDFTPINEPVTTARFAYLYGHWHPHDRDEARFLRAVVASARATAAAMAAIRRRTPGARLVQTEDFGRSFSTPTLAYQCEYENARRFLGLDLLTGRVERGHFFWRRLIDAGVLARDLEEIAEAPCPPQVIGLDHYLTSDRFLDAEIGRHPGVPPGGNGREVYVDIAAAHVPELRADVGVLPRLRELDARYGLPLAITEVHNGCTREEQLRWLLEAWRAAQAARDEGVEVVAVTSWALLGARDWNSLMVEPAGHYESGAFDARCDPPRITAVGHAVAALARTGDYRHPLVELAGWWREGAGAERIAGLPHLSVAGAAGEVERFAGCCRLRRIPIVEGPRRAAAVLGEIRIDAGARAPLRFRYFAKAAPEAPRLLVEAPAGADFGWAANAFLDLVIDGETGALRLEGLGRGNQYVAVRLSDGVPEDEAAGERPAARRLRAAP